MITLKFCEEGTWPLEWDTNVFIRKQQIFKFGCFYIFMVEHSFIPNVDTRISFKVFVPCPKLHSK